MWQLENVLQKSIESLHFLIFRYGFQDAVTPHDIMHWNSSSWPHSTPTSDLSILTDVSLIFEREKSNGYHIKGFYLGC